MRWSRTRSSIGSPSRATARSPTTCCAGRCRCAPRGSSRPALAEADRQRIHDLYAKRGRFAASVEPKLIQLDQNRVDVVFQIKDGDAALVSTINFVGNSAFSDSRLRE